MQEKKYSKNVFILSKIYLCLILLRNCKKNILTIKTLYSKFILIIYNPTSKTTIKHIIFYYISLTTKQFYNKTYYILHFLSTSYLKYYYNISTIYHE